MKTKDKTLIDLTGPRINAYKDPAFSGRLTAPTLFKSNPQSLMLYII